MSAVNNKKNSLSDFWHRFTKPSGVSSSSPEESCVVSESDIKAAIAQIDFPFLPLSGCDEEIEFTFDDEVPVSWDYNGRVDDPSFQRYDPSSGNPLPQVASANSSVRAASYWKNPDSKEQQKAEKPESSKKANEHSPTQRTKKIVGANLAAAETYLNERFSSWSWITNWNEEVPVAFADVMADEQFMTIYFDVTTGLPTAVEAETSGDKIPSAFNWPNEDVADTVDPVLGKPSRLRQLAKEYVDAHYDSLLFQMSQAAEMRSNTLLNAEDLPEDKGCWDEICSVLNDIAFNTIPVSVYLSGDQLYVSAKINDMFTEDEMNDFAPSL